MHKLLLLGATLIGFGGHAAHQQPRYWWPAMDTCAVMTGRRRDGVWIGKPYIQCAAQPAHWSAKPPPVEQPAG
jgi:hypothetical protein